MFDVTQAGATVDAAVAALATFGLVALIRAAVGRSRSWNLVTDVKEGREFKIGQTDDWQWPNRKAA